MVKPDYDLTRHALNNGSVWQYHVSANGSHLTLKHALERLADDKALRKAFTAAVQRCGFEAARFETPATTIDSLDKAFEFVLIDSPGLIRPADPWSFREQFDDNDADNSVIAFQNLGGDATMIVPRPVGDDPPYTHLLDFLNNAPIEQTDDLWSLTARTLLEQIGDTPLWLNTAGAGVPWLHLRIDQRPKYYRHRPYSALP